MTEVTGDAVTLILSTIDRIKELLAELERTDREPGGSDQDLIGRLAQAVVEHASAEESPAAGMAAESPAFMVPRRPLRPGEAVLDDLERAFRETPGLKPAPSAEPQPKRT